MKKQTPTILFIDHHENPMDDIAWTHLGDQGFERRLVCPFRGETLDIDPGTLAGVVIYGGAQNVHEQDQFPFLTDEIRWLERAIVAEIPVLGICLGGQLLAHTLGARVGPRKPRQCEFGFYEVSPTEAGKSFMAHPMTVVQAHFEEFEVPDTAIRLVGGEVFPNQAFRYQDHVVGLQFHPEVTEQVFRRWQNADWAFFGENGAQTRAEQDALLPVHAPIQSRWFKQTLGGMFGSPA